MTIEYGAPLSRAMNRMKAVLFNPFDIGKWFTLGFAAFLADLMEGHGASFFKNGLKRSNIREASRFPDTFRNWLDMNSDLLVLIISGIVLLILVFLLLLWISSRGKFTFLYNIINNETKISLPWNEYKKEGNSLFRWQLGFGLISFACIAALGIFGITFFNQVDNFGFGSGSSFFTISGLVLTSLLVIIILNIIDCFLNSFVVPIMYKNRLGALEAWKKFLPLFSRHVGHFIVFALFKFLLNIILLIMVMTFGLFTCCIGFVFLIIPYIGSVVLLPISYMFTSFNLEYFEQFGPDYKLLTDLSLEDHESEEKS